MQRDAIRVDAPPGGVRGVSLLVALDQAGQPVPGPRVAVVGLVHGNEIVGDGVLHTLRDRAERQLVAGSLLLVRANLDAFALNLRHTPEGSDMNRMWGPSRLARLVEADPVTLSPEEQRVRELAPLLLECEAILDLHSTSRPTPPFLVFRDDLRHALVAARLGVLRLVTGLHEGAILDGATLPDVGLVPGERSSRLGFTFEAGQHLDPTNHDRALGVAERFLEALGVWTGAPPAPPLRPEVYEVMDRYRQAPGGTVPYRFVGYAGGEPGGGRRGPPRALASFEEVEADEVLLRRGHGTVVRAQTPFTMLLPTPAAAPGTDLYYQALRRPWRAPEAMPRTDEEARIEAVGVERMLDLLEDDDAARGSTRISFDARQVLDRCADLVGRTLRMPEDHPHRCITVVGRGDWGGEEAERRAGQRWRTAMRRALALGVPMKRIQLLRGAQLGWLQTMTGAGTHDLLQRRAATGADPLRLFLSVRQPHTVALLVVGDLKRALAERDFRRVHVAMVVEAATVEPDGEVARVRVVRAGLFSSRAELLGAAARLLGALEEEHRHLVRQPPLCDVPGLELGQDDAILPPPDPHTLQALRHALLQMQLDQWAQVLQPELRAERLDAPGARGAWLARIMASTGIMDERALEALLIEADATGTPWVDPGRFERLAADPSSLPPIPGHLERPAPPQPLIGEDVVADDLERWVGWKRFVRCAQVIPDTRGKDLDLLFSESAIRDRVTGWLNAACELAAAAPGRVMLVVAGDGLKPSRRPATEAGRALLQAQQRALCDPNLAYLRIQHAQGTHLAWMKDLVQTLALRPTGGAPVALQWEASHGVSVNVMLVAVRESEVAAEPWSLEGWSIERCSVLVSKVRGTVRDTRVGLFTEPLPGARINQDLLHFGRAHCERLLGQGGARIRGDGGAPPQQAFDAFMVEQVSGWLERARGLRSEPSPDGLEDRAVWLASRLGLSDRDLALALLSEVHGDRAPGEVAREIWAGVRGWDDDDPAGPEPGLGD